MNRRRWVLLAAIAAAPVVIAAGGWLAAYEVWWAYQGRKWRDARKAR